MPATVPPVARSAPPARRRLGLSSTTLITWVLLPVVILSVPGAVQAAAWSPDLPDLHLLAACAFGVATLLVLLPLSGRMVAIGVVLAGAPFVLWRLFRLDDFAATPGIEGRLVELGARLADWADRAVAGARIHDSVPFVFLMLCGAWLVVAGGTALALRARRPWPLVLVLAATLLAALDRAPGSADWRLPLFAASALALAAHLRAPSASLGSGPRMRYSTYLSPVAIATVALAVAGLWLGVRAMPTDWLPHQLQLPWVEEQTVTRAPAAPTLPAPRPAPPAPASPDPLPPAPATEVPAFTPPPASPVRVPDVTPPSAGGGAQLPAWAWAVLYAGIGLIGLGSVGRFAWLWTLRHLSVPERNWASLCRVVWLLGLAPPRSCTPSEAAARLTVRLGDGCALRRLALDYQHARYGRWRPSRPEAAANTAAWDALKPRLLGSAWRGVPHAVSRTPWWTPRRPVWRRPAWPTRQPAGLSASRRVRFAGAALAAGALIGGTAWVAVPRSTNGPLEQTAPQAAQAVPVSEERLAAALPAEVPPAEPPRTWTVQPGDTLSGIAAAHRTTVAAIMRLNDLLDADLIVVGQVLLLP